MYLNKSETSNVLVNLFSSSNDAVIEVRDDAAFKANQWLALAELNVRVPVVANDSDRTEAVRHALSLGGYEIAILSANELESRLRECAPGSQAMDASSIRAAAEAVAYAIRRTALMPFPFDSASAAQMPYAEPTTVVFDTTGVIQGALNQFLRMGWGALRIKVPAIVHMEVLNLLERYMKRRRAGIKDKKFGAAIQEHAHAFGAQRALLRLGANSAMDIERSRLGADPLRGVVQPDSDAEDRQLGLSHVTRSFADRLILETALQHQRELYSSSHPVRLVTSDQGLARMSLAEGLNVVFFSAKSAGNSLGKTLLGRRFNPFNSKQEVIPFAEVLWELAASFGAVRVRTTASSVSIHAIAEDLTWEPSHVAEDLLFIKSPLDILIPRDRSEPTALVVPSQKSAVAQPNRPFVSSRRADEPLPVLAPASPVRSTQRNLKGSYKIGVVPAYQLALEAMQRGRLTMADAERQFDLMRSGFREYGNAFSLMNVAAYDGSSITPTEETKAFVAAYEELAIDRLDSYYRRISSFEAFLGSHGSVGIRYDMEKLVRSVPAARAYTTLSEVLRHGLVVGRDYYVSTPTIPFDQQFVAMAEAAYTALANENGLALAGAWLEFLAERFGIHPAVSRILLQSTSDGGLLHRFVEGSSPDRMHTSHVIRELSVNEQGKPALIRVNLYGGTYLVPGTASVAIRVVKPA